MQTLFIFILQIESRGSKCIPVQCDHSKDEEVEKLFQRVKTEQKGQLDLLVNNAYSAVTVSIVSLGSWITITVMGLWDATLNTDIPFVRTV